MTRIYLRVGACLRPVALAFQDLNAYSVTWCDALVGELHAFKAAKRRLYARTAAPRRASREGAIRAHPQSNSNDKAHALLAWRSNAERVARHW
jgi:hypothetical protein